MGQLGTLKSEIKSILTNTPETRNNDMILYYEYCVKNLVRETEIFKVFKDSQFRIRKKIAPFESVSRVRREIQCEYSDLKPSEKVQEQKKILEQEYHDYYATRIIKKVD